MVACPLHGGTHSTVSLPGRRRYLKCDRWTKGNKCIVSLLACRKGVVTSKQLRSLQEATASSALMKRKRGRSGLLCGAQTRQSSTLQIGSSVQTVLSLRPDVNITYTE